MPEAGNPQQQPDGRRNVRVATICALVAVGMVGMSYAAVPLYRIFCQVTGYAGTTQRAEQAPSADAILDRKITVRFDANVGPGLAWEFVPVVRTMDVRIGESALAFYRATNRSDRAIVGTATFNVTPSAAGSHFAKVACFCFTEQRLEPGETMEMPVSFFIDPSLVTDKDARHLDNITLSYTFFRSEKQEAARASDDVTVPAEATGHAGGKGT